MDNNIISNTIMGNNIISNTIMGDNIISNTIMGNNIISSDGHDHDLRSSIVDPDRDRLSFENDRVK